ncbi:MAG TPA: glutamine amidotransferase family protein [Baekduia sp.]|nr:glutamine amidotransferase family protein [Baekduia sp.]
MCGIVGLYSKSPAVQEHLGAHLASMLVQMADRGPDSAGLAVYGEPVDGSKLSLRLAAGADWHSIEGQMREALGIVSAVFATPEQVVVTVDAAPAEARSYMTERFGGLVTLVSVGRAIELYKEAVHPSDFIASFGVEKMSGSHGLGHTRMATESKITTDGSHPFSTGDDLCLVHNGSLSNHNQLRRMLRKEGIHFQTENDSEVAAGYLTWRMREGATLEQALEGCLEDLDGFFTFAVGTFDGFAVLRDPIACKPAVMAETDDWVAMASEYRALAVLPGAADARVWEPEPGRVYSWSAVTA